MASCARSCAERVAERGTIGELLAELNTAPPSARMPSRAAWESLSLDDQRVLIRGLLRRLEVSKSAVLGGSHRRGIDFAQRVRFVLGWEWSTAWDAIERTFDDDDELFDRSIQAGLAAFAAGEPIAFER